MVVGGSLFLVGCLSFDLFFFFYNFFNSYLVYMGNFHYAILPFFFPQIGPSCWNSILDASGHSPYSYAFMKNNHSYNKLVARKLADRRNGQVTIPVGVEIEQSGLTKEQVHGLSSQSKQRGKSCTKCAVAAAKLNKRVRGSQGLLNRPYIHSMLAIAAVCVCVCLFLRGSPDIGLVAPFKWENLDFGPM